MISLELILFILSGLILGSILLTKLSDNLGVPSLVLFILIGMLAGINGPGKINFSDFRLSQSVGIIALVFILFSGGLDTKWKNVSKVLWGGISLATFGIAIVTVSIGLFCYYILKLDLFVSLLLGAIISSTDAAAVFSSLGTKGTKLKGRVKSLLEFESGSNDPLAIFLTIVLIEMTLSGGIDAFDIFYKLIFQFLIGITVALISGKIIVYVFNHLKFQNDSLYTVLAIAFALLVYGTTSLLHGSGMLAVYISALIIGNSDFVQKRSVKRFFDGLALLSQIVMFLTLGLLSTPADLVPVIGSGLLISVVLIFVARPLSVFISLMFSKFSVKEKIFISWVGLRGAVPIILATFPIIAGVNNSFLIFNLVFFITVTSALIQGWSIPLSAKILNIDEPESISVNMPIEMSGKVRTDKEMIDIIIPYNSEITGKTLAEISLPGESLIILISRDGEFVVPSGSSALEEGDTLLVLVNKENLSEVKEKLMRVKQK